MSLNVEDMPLYRIKTAFHREAAMSMGRITDKSGELKLSLWKIIVMALITGFFTIVAKNWEQKQRREFKKAVPYKGYSAEKLEGVLLDFQDLVSCRDPYVEHFYEKHPDFSPLHRLWVLNSNGYWQKKLLARLKRLRGSKPDPPEAKRKHIYPSTKKFKLLDRLDYLLVDYFGNYCEVRSLEFLLSWGKLTEHRTCGKWAKKLFDWFCNYYCGFLVPAEGSLGRGVTVMPYESILELVKRVRVGQIWPCSCKSFRETDEGIPRATCMLIAEVASLDDSVVKYPGTGSLSADNLIKKLKEFEEIGLIHQIMCVSSPQGRKMYVLCNCDSRACVPMFLKTRYGIPIVRGSGFVCVQGDMDKCTGCGRCAKRCRLGAVVMEEGKPFYDESRCLGCGLCVSTCPTGIRSMRRKVTEPFHEYTTAQIERCPEKTVRT